RVIDHDLNNILTPILVGAQMLRDESVEENRQSTISLIEESAQRGANVVKQVLTFARGIEGERVLLKPDHLIEEMIDIAKKTFPKIDDEPNILQITKMIFEKHNYRVVSANDGPEALALFAQQMGSIGGVLTDLAM